MFPKKCLLLIILIYQFKIISAQSIGNNLILDHLKTATHPNNCNSYYICSIPNDSIWVNFNPNEKIQGLFYQQWIDKSGKELVIETGFNRSNYDVRLIKSNFQYSEHHFVTENDWVQLPNVTWNYLFSINCFNNKLNSERYMVPLDFEKDFKLNNLDTIIGIEITFLINNDGSKNADLAGVYIIEPINCTPLNIGNDTSICIGDSIILKSNINYFNIIWQDTIVANNYIVNKNETVVVKTENQCGVQTDTINITSIDCCELFIPNIFSPNNDGINDTFLPTINCAYSDFKISIYNRWGQQIFKSNNINQAWNGKSNNQNLPPDTYFYSIQLKNNNGQQILKFGDVLLIN